MKRFLLSLMVAFVALIPSMAQDALHESFEGGVLPAGWTQEYVRTPMTLGVDTASFSWNVESTTPGDTLAFPRGAASGLGRVAARNSSSDEMRFVTRLISPVFNASNLFLPQVLFSHAEPALAGSSDTLRVYYRASQGDPWHAFQKAVYQRNATWKHEVLGLIAPSATYQLAFEITENMGYGVVLDSIVVRSTPTCRDVVDVHGINIHAFDATVIWSEEGYYDHFEVMVTSQPVTNFAAIDPAIVVLRDNEVYNTELVVSNLQPETTYYVYVRSDCQENASGFTDWAEGQFTTLAVAYLPYTQNFNTQVNLPGGIYFGLPVGWLTGSSIADNTVPFVYSGGSKGDRGWYSVDSTAYLSFSAENKANALGTPLPVDAYAFAVSPEVMADDLTGVEVAFWATAYDKVSVGTADYASSLLVGVMSDPSDFNTFVVIDTVKVNTGYQFQRYTVSLAGYQGNGKFVALASYFNKRNAIYVDNFQLTQPATLTPTKVKVSDANSLGFKVSADLNGADSWNVMVSSEYSRTGDVSASSVLYTGNGLTQAEAVVADAALAGQIVRVYTQAVKNGVPSAWSFPVTLRVPTKMTLPYANSCDVVTGLQPLANLGSELRVSTSQQAMASVFYPLAGISSGVKNYPVLESTAPNYMGAHARFEGVDSWFTLPEVDNLSNLKMVFRFASLSSGKIEVGVMTDPYDLSTFEQIATFTSSINEYRRGLVSFDAYQGEGKFIAFRSVNANVPTIGSNMLLDQIIVEELGDCREASNVQIVAEPNDAHFTWNGGGMDAWIVSLSTVRQMMNSKVDTVYSPEYTFTELEPEHTYYFTIQTVCGDSLLDLDQVYYEFRTPRGLPYVESFKSYGSTWPSEWTRSNTKLADAFNGTPLSSTTGGWSLTNSSSYVFAPQSGYVAFMDLWSTSCYWMLSPVLEISSAVEAMELTFDLGIHGYNGWASAGQDDVFGVLVSTDGGNTWSRQNAFLWTNDGTGDFVLDDLNWEASQTITLNFNAFVGQTIQFAFYGGSTVSGNGDSYFSVDNISLHRADPRCGGIKNLRAVAQGTNEGNLSWSLEGSDPYPALLQVASNSTYTNFVYNDTVTSATSSLHLTDLQSSTRYYVRMMQLCPGGSDWVEASFATACDARTPEAFGTENFDDAAVLDCWTVGYAYDNGSGSLPQRISNDKFGQVLRITKDAVSETASDGAYAVSPEFIIPDSMNHYQVVFRAGAYSDESTNVSRIKVGVVTDPADAANTFESMATLRLAHANDSLGLKTYVVSFENYQGDYNEEYGRHIMFFSEAGSDSTNFVYIDDIRLEPAQSCHMVLNVDVDSISEDGAMLHWDGDSESYELLVAKTYGNAETIADAVLDTVMTDTELYLANLDANTIYYVYVRAICGEDSARWSSATGFRTAYGIFFEDWEENNPLTAHGWTQGKYKMETMATFHQSDFETGANWSITTPNTTYTTVTGVDGKVARVNIYGSTIDRAWLISPSIDLSQLSSGAMLNFNLAVYPYSSGVGASAATDKRFAVLVSADNGQTWVPSEATVWDCTGRADYDFRQLSEHATRFGVDLSQYVGNVVKIGFYGESTGSSADIYYALDSIGVSKYTAECLGVRDLKLALEGTSQLKATWRHISTPYEAVVELSTDAQFTNVLQRDTLTDTEIVYDGILPNMTYYVRATQADCDNAKSVVARINTPKAIPYDETFGAAAIAEDWTVMKGSVQAAFNDTLPKAVSSTAWKISTSSAGLPANHLVGELYRQSTQTEFWLVSPSILLTDDSNDDLVLLFDLALTAHNKDTASSSPAATDDQEFRVLLSTDDGESWSEDNQWLFANTANAYKQLSAISGVEHVRLDLSDYRNQRVRLAFYKASTHSRNDNDIHIANLQVRVVGEECLDPTDLTLDTVSFTMATVSWQADDEHMTLVQYASLADFSNAKVDTLLGATSHTLQSLTPATNYFVRVKHVCGENSSSNWTPVLQFTTSLGLPYFDALTGRDNWSAYTTATGTPAVTPVWEDSKASAGWRGSTKAEILGGPHVGCARANNTFWLVSPEIDLTPNTSEAVIALSLDLALTSSYSSASAPSASATANKHFYVMISTDNGETWPEENRWEWSSDAAASFSFQDIPAGLGKNYQVDITRFGGEKLRVALVLEGASSGTLAMNAANFNIVALASNCFGVGNIVVNHVDTAALVSVAPLDDAQMWQVAYGLKDEAIDAMATVVANHKDSIMLPGLKLSSEYDVYARSICAEGDTSVWFGPINFTTPLGLTYLEPFAGSLSDWTRYTGITDSIFVGHALTATTSGWTTVSSSNVLGAPHVACAKSAKDNWLVSPVINMMPEAGSTKSLYLSFDMALTGSTSSIYAPTNVSGHSFRIAVSEDGGLTWTADNSILFADSTAAYLYSSIPAGAGRSYHLNISKYLGKEIRIAFIMGAATGTSSSAIHIGALELAEYDVPCFGLASATVNYSHNVTTCVITPDAEDVASLWQYEVVEAGFMPTGATAVTVADTLFTITDLAPATTFDFYFRSICSAVDTSAWYGPVQLKTPYAVRYEETMNWTAIHADWDEYGYNAISGTFSPSTSGYWDAGASKNNEAFGVNHAYINASSTRKSMLVSPQIDLYSCIGHSVQLSFDMALTAAGSSEAPSSTRGQSLELRVSTDKGATWGDAVAVWGEGNRVDYLYEDISAAGENYMIDLSEYAGEDVQLGFYSVSTGTCSNDLHIRNVVVDTVVGTYCMPVRRVSLVDSTLNSVTIAIRAQGIQDAIDIQYICQPEYNFFNERLAQHADTNVITISGLQSSMAYDIYARTMCADSTLTPWAGPFTVHTAECSNVLGIASYTLTLTDADITLLTRDAAAAVGYQLFLTDKGGVLDETQAMTSSTNRFQFAREFATSTSYDVYARKICLVGDTAEWVGPFSVKTPLGQLGNVIFSESLDKDANTLSSDWGRYSTTNTTIPTPATAFSSSTSGWTVGSGRNAYVYGTNHAYENIYSTRKYILATPVIDLGAINTTGAALSFDLALTDYSNGNAPDSGTDGQRFEIRVSRDNGLTWELVEAWAPADAAAENVFSSIPTTGETYMVNLTDYVGDQIRIGFYSCATVSGPDNDLHLRNVIVYEAGEAGEATVCKGVNAITVDDIKLNAAQMHITYADAENGKYAFFELATDPEFSSVVMADTINGNTYVLRGLQASTTYYVHAKSLCGDDESRFSSPVSFRTKYGVRFYEEFESSQVLDEWSRGSGSLATVLTGGSISSTSSGWNQTSDVRSMGTAHMRVNVWGSSCLYWLISPSIDLGPNVGESLLFAFDVATTKYSSGTSEADPTTEDKFVVAVSTDDGATWSANNLFIWDHNESAGTPQHMGHYDTDLTLAPQRVVLDFTRFAGQTIKVAFYGESTVAGGDNYLHIDNVEINRAESYNYTDTICSSAEYDNYGFAYAGGVLQPGMNNLSRMSAELDSVVYLNLFVKESYVINLVDTICEGHVYNDYGYNFVASQSGVQRRRLVAENGCDSLVLLNLTVNPIQYADVELYACLGTSYMLNDKAYYSNAVVKDTVESLLNGCDSVITYYINFSDRSSYAEDIRVAVCPGEPYVVADTIELFEPGDYRFEMQSMGGCDSTLTLHLLAADIEGNIYDTIRVEDLPYTYNGREMLKNLNGSMQDYEYHVVTACQTAGLLHLHVVLKQDEGFDSIYDGRKTIEKVILDDHLYIIVDGKWYDATGHIAR